MWLYNYYIIEKLNNKLPIETSIVQRLVNCTVQEKYYIDPILSTGLNKYENTQL